MTQRDFQAGDRVIVRKTVEGPTGTSVGFYPAEVIRIDGGFIKVMWPTGIQSLHLRNEVEFDTRRRNQ